MRVTGGACCAMLSVLRCAVLFCVLFLCVALTRASPLLQLLLYTPPSYPTLPWSRRVRCCRGQGHGMVWPRSRVVPCRAVQAVLMRWDWEGLAES